MLSARYAAASATILCCWSFNRYISCLLSRCEGQIDCQRRCHAQRAHQRQPVEHVFEQRTRRRGVAGRTKTFTWMRAILGCPCSPTTSRYEARSPVRRSPRPQRHPRQPPPVRKRPEAVDHLAPDRTEGGPIAATCGDASSNSSGWPIENWPRPTETRAAAGSSAVTRSETVMLSIRIRIPGCDSSSPFDSANDGCEGKAARRAAKGTIR